MAPPQATADFYRAQQRRIVATLGMVRREWAGMGSDFDSSWATVGPRVAVLTTAAQLGAAKDGVAYVEAIVGGVQTADVVPGALAGIASDGRPLASLLDNAVIEAKRGVAAGDTVADALARGGRHLDMTVHTQVADAGRDATSLGVTARPHISWVRMVNPPCCQRCAVQSGKVFRFNQGFKRHPRCDCIHVPQRDDNPHTAGIHIGPDDVKDLTAKQRKAIADGADFNKTVNDRRRKRGDYLPPTRVDRILQSSRTREDAVKSLTDAGYLRAPTTAPARWDPKWDEARSVHLRKVDEWAQKSADRLVEEIAEEQRRVAEWAQQIAEREAYLKSVMKPAELRKWMKTTENLIPHWQSMIDISEDLLKSFRRQLDALGDTKPVLPKYDPANPLAFYGDRVKVYSKTDQAASQAADIEKFPESAHRVLRDHFAEVDGSGFHIGIEGSLTDVDAFSSLKGVAARGHGGGLLDDVGGAYLPGKRVCGCTDHNHGSVSVGLHEGSHALDDAIRSQSGEFASKSDEFRRTWDRLERTTDAVEGSYNLNPYYRSTLNESGALSEGFAESYAAFVESRNLKGDDLVWAILDQVTTRIGTHPEGVTLAGRRLVSFFKKLERDMAAMPTSGGGA